MQHVVDIYFCKFMLFDCFLLVWVFILDTSLDIYMLRRIGHALPIIGHTLVNG